MLQWMKRYITKYRKKEIIFSLPTSLARAFTKLCSFDYHLRGRVCIFKISNYEKSYREGYVDENTCLSINTFISFCSHFVSCSMIAKLANLPKREKVPWRWCAPESILAREFTTKSDIWMFGMHNASSRSCIFENPLVCPSFVASSQQTPLLLRCICSWRKVEYAHVEAYFFICPFVMRFLCGEIRYLDVWNAYCCFTSVCFVL